VQLPLLQAFPFPSTPGEVTLHPLSLSSMFIYSSCGKWAISLPLWSFPPTPTFTSFPTPGCWACDTAPAFSTCLVYLQFCERFPLPTLWCSGHPALFLLCVFFVVIAYYSVFFFFPGWGLVCPGGYADLAQGCLWEYHMPFSSPFGLHLLQRSGHWHLAVVWEPSWFLHLM
jgi:hypothetical protein